MKLLLFAGLSMTVLFAQPDSPWRKWVTEDVVYIITDQERATFSRLTTNDERERFIEQFWQRRDPTPGTPVNEAKEEHYRRIARSNERFSDSDLPGWKTDRGRIYITFGPPDEIDSHPTTEQWTYRHIDGIGNNVMVDFVADAPGGRLRMTLDPRAR